MNEIFTIFKAQVDEKVCPYYNIVSWTRIPVVLYSLCNYWVYSHEGSSCLEYYNGIDVNHMNCNFYCLVCLDNLVKYYKNIFNKTDIDGIINCLDSFNLEDVLKDEEDTE